MHKFKRIDLNSFLALIVSGAFLFVGCSSDEDPAAANIDVALLLGSWQNVQTCPDTNDGIIFLTENQFFSETADNTSICEFDASCGFTQSGTYSITGNEIAYSNVTLQSIDYTPDDDFSCVVVSDGTTGERFEIEALTATTLVIARFDPDNGGDLVPTGSVTYTKLE